MTGVLSSLLPGLRQLRAPLAAGYTWLAVSWLMLHSHVTKPKPGHGLLGDLYGLTLYFGKPVTLAVLSFLAYLVGILSERISESVLTYTAGRRKIEAKIAPAAIVPIMLQPPHEYTKEELTEFRRQGVLWSRYFRRPALIFTRSVPLGRNGIGSLKMLAVQIMAERLVNSGVETQRQVSDALTFLDGMMLSSRAELKELGEMRGSDEMNPPASGESREPWWIATSRSALRYLDSSRKRGAFIVNSAYLQELELIKDSLEQATDTAKEASERRGALKICLDLDSYAQLLSVHLEPLPNALLVQDPDLYGEYDRLRAEGQFRAAVALPLIALSCVLAAITSDVRWLGVLVFPLLLFVSAIGRIRSAGDTLASVLPEQRYRGSAVDELTSASLRIRLPVATNRGELLQALHAH